MDLLSLAIVLEMMCADIFDAIVLHHSFILIFLCRLYYVSIILLLLLYLWCNLKYCTTLFVCVYRPPIIIIFFFIPTV
jgi:hypothetical protein